MKKNKCLSFSDLVNIEVGGAICLPILMVGHKLVQAIGFAGSLGAVLLGNLVLFCLAVVAAKMSIARRKKTPENARDYLGGAGVKVLAGVLFTAKCCWFALQLNLMSLTFIQLLDPYLSSAHFYSVNIICGILIMAITMIGIEGVSRFSSLCLPFMICTLVYSLIGADSSAIQLQPIVFSTEALAIVIGAPITAVIDMPTYFSQSRSGKDSIRAVCAMFLVALPVIEGVGVYLASCSPSDNFLAVFTQGNGALWNLWISLFILLAAWTTNTTNLYSATVCLDSLVKNKSHYIRCIITTAIAVGISLLNILEHFSLFLNVLVVVVGSLGAVILSAYCLQGDVTSARTQKGNLLGGIAGIAIGLSSVFHMFSLSGVAIVDAFCFSFLATIFVNKCFGVNKNLFVSNHIILEKEY
jgi:cytosine permease